jgi:hypothetical protein
MHTPFVFARFTPRASHPLIKLTALRVLVLFSQALLEEPRPPREVAGELSEYGNTPAIGFMCKDGPLHSVFSWNGAKSGREVPATEQLRATD